MKELVICLVVCAPLVGILVAVICEVRRRKRIKDARAYIFDCFMHYEVTPSDCSEYTPEPMSEAEFAELRKLRALLLREEVYDRLRFDVTNWLDQLLDQTYTASL
jgi:hypothetical protein